MTRQATRIVESSKEESGAKAGYHEIAAVLLARVRDGRYQPGQKIPTESELCAEFEVSRVTIRRALASLIEKQMLESRQGAGTFVPLNYVAPPPNFNVKLLGPQRDKWRKGDSFKFLGSKVVRPDKQEKAFFGAGVKTAEVFEYLRLRQNTPTDSTAFLFSDWAAAHIVDRSEAMLLHIGPYLKERGIAPYRSQQFVGAVTADKVLAERLQIPIGAPLVRVRMLNWDQENRPYSCITSFHVADRYELGMELTVSAEETHMKSVFVSLPEMWPARPTRDPSKA